MKCTWMTTESGDETADFVQVYITFNGGGTESLVVNGLPSEAFARDRMIGEAVHMFVSKWEDTKILADLTADLERVISITERASTSPPMVAEFLIACLAPKNSAQALLGDLDELFQENAVRFGERKARRKYWMQVASSFMPWLKRFVVTVVVGYIRSKIGI